MGDLKTDGSGWVDPLGLPLAEAMVTVGRVAIFVRRGVVVLWCWGEVDVDVGASMR